MASTSSKRTVLSRRSLRTIASTALRAAAVTGALGLSWPAAAAENPLHRAVVAPDFNASRVERLVRRDPSLLEAFDDRGHTPLSRLTSDGRFSASVERRSTRIRTLLALGARIDAPTGSGTTPLCGAVELGMRETIDLLVASGASPHDRCHPRHPNDLTTAFSLMAGRSTSLTYDAASRERLVAWALPPTSRDKAAEALQFIVLAGHDPVAARFLPWTVPDLSDGEPGALITAARALLPAAEASQAATLLLARGAPIPEGSESIALAEIKIRDLESLDALFARFGRRAMNASHYLELLSTAVPNPDIAPDRTRMLGRLIEEGVPLPSRILHAACAIEGSPDIAQDLALLAEAGASFLERDGEGQVPIHRAVAAQNHACIHAHVQAGHTADTTGTKLTPLQLAVERGQVETARLLIELSADPRQASRKVDGSLLFQVALADAERTFASSALQQLLEEHVTLSESERAQVRRTFNRAQADRERADRARTAVAQRRLAEERKRSAEVQAQLDAWDAAKREAEARDAAHKAAIDQERLRILEQYRAHEGCQVVKYGRVIHRGGRQCGDTCYHGARRGMCCGNREFWRGYDPSLWRFRHYYDRTMCPLGETRIW